MYLRTERLVLRRLSTEDIPLFVLLNDDPEVMRHIDWQPPSVDEVAEEVAEIVAAYEKYPDHGRFVAESPDGGFLGWFGLRVTDAGPSAPDLGYRLRRSDWGRGLATEGSRALIDHAFTNLAADRVTADVMMVNTRSRNVLERCGMRHTRTFHVDFEDPLPGTEHGEGFYEITRAEWLARR
ncbi:RimJ/RimL family protein N-acetyltransferase [Herbihabitans rhizosphaerae]|uniref:RimJ/RimL family protein N-acetyltransferase n=1 Tax=Herbihabitans rhizosphaerae TaxID=1872711 RepID=A0A4Q7L5A4_9PSEU|nr:GNAT family N-acetyltransferase [Herbihabitans rhizosphaerae]RZS44406.1 RimJ/RimL family protein N-acetyltransferase [Herbihabitans rhizosphaerae]